MVTQYEELYHGIQRSCHMVFVAEDELTVKLRLHFGGDTTFKRNGCLRHVGRRDEYTDDDCCSRHRGRQMSRVWGMVRAMSS